MYKFGPDQQPCDCTIFDDGFRIVNNDGYGIFHPTGYELNLGEIRYIYNTGDFYIRSNRELQCATTNTTTLGVQVPNNLVTDSSLKIRVHIKSAPVANSQFQIQFSENDGDYVYWRWDNTVKSGYMGIYLNGVDSTQYSELSSSYTDTSWIACQVFNKVDKPGLSKTVIGYGDSRSVAFYPETPPDDGMHTTVGYVIGDIVNGNWHSGLFGGLSNSQSRNFRFTQTNSYSNPSGLFRLKFINNTGVISQIRVASTNIHCCNTTSDLSFKYPTGFRQPLGYKAGGWTATITTGRQDSLGPDFAHVFSYRARPSGENKSYNPMTPMEHPVLYNNYSTLVSGVFRGCGLTFDAVATPPDTLLMDVSNITNGKLLSYIGSVPDPYDPTSLTDCQSWIAELNNYANYTAYDVCDCSVFNGTHTLYKIAPGLYESDDFVVDCPNYYYSTSGVYNCNDMGIYAVVRLRAAAYLSYYDFNTNDKEIDIGIGISGVIYSGYQVISSPFSDQLVNAGNYFATGVNYDNGTFSVYGNPSHNFFTFFGCGAQKPYWDDFQCYEILPVPPETGSIYSVCANGYMSYDGTANGVVTEHGGNPQYMSNPACTSGYRGLYYLCDGNPIDSLYTLSPKLPNLSIRLRTP